MVHENQTEELGEKTGNKQSISVIIPAHNAEKTIALCIASLLRQTFRDFHALIIVNGSTDHTEQIAYQLTKNDPRFQVFSLQAGDLSTALNFGIRRSQDPFIAFLDADDIYAECFLGNILQLLLTANSDMAVCGLSKFEEGQEPVFTDGMGNPTIYQGEHRFDLLLSEPVLGPIRMVKLYKRELLDNIEFPEGHIYEDEYAAYDLYRHARKIVRTDAIWYGYRQTEGSITNKKIQARSLTDTGHALFSRVYNAVRDGETKVARHALQKACADICYRYIQLPEEERKSKQTDVIMQITKRMLRKYEYLLTGKERMKFRIMLNCPWLLRYKARSER